MNYLLKNKPKYENKNKIYIVVIFFVFLNFFGYFFSNFTREALFFIAKPIWSVSSIMIKPVKSVGIYFVSKNSLVEENVQLKEELSAMKLKEIDFELIKKENQDFREQLGHNSPNRVISRVLSRPPQSPYDTLVIDVGSLHGVYLENKVYSSENIIIGKIKEVTSSTSIVELFSRGGLRQEATLLRTGASFTLVGKGGANFGLEVPKDTDIVFDDVFTYPGFSNSIFGSVYHIDSSSQSSFKKIYLKIPGNIFSVQWVFVEGL